MSPWERVPDRGFFERVHIEVPGAHVKGWVADREGVFHEAYRGYGGQAYTAHRVLESRRFSNVERMAWITTVRSVQRGAGAAALHAMLEKFDRAGVEVVGLIVVPDDDAYLERLVDYYRRFGFEELPGGAFGPDPVMVR